MASNKLRNVGIFAHVDAGKTTTTEHILFESGRIRSLGSVDQGTAQTDFLDVEMSRGISVRAATTRFAWQGAEVNVVDTPGHVDFSAEVERALRIMDGAVLIVSAAEGVQSQTEVIWHALRKLNIPTLIYLNKMDRTGVDAEEALEGVRRYLSPAVVPIQRPLGEGEAFVGAEDLFGTEWSGTDAPEQVVPLLEAVAEGDEGLLERYLDGRPIGCGEFRESLVRQVRAGKLFPVLYGASGKGIGVTALMDAIVGLLPPPKGDPERAVSGVVFKIERDRTMGRMAFVRLYQGRIGNRDSVFNATQGIEEKVAQIRKIDGRRSEDVGVLEAGDIAAVCGFGQARIGDVLGSREGVPEEPRLAVPLLTVQVHWADERDYPAVVAAMQELADEDPLLDLQWLQEERELHAKVMGPIQLEILISMLETRFGLKVRFGEPSVIYKETPAKAGEGHVAYLMPKPCWAVLRFRIEPGERGSGLVYAAQVRADRLLEQYQNQVAQTVPEALQQGLYGWQVTDLKVTLIDGEHHVWHTHPLDFVTATPMGIMNGLANTGTRLLEPMLAFRITVPEEFGGKVMNDLALMRAEFGTPVAVKGRFELEGLLPVATSLDYPIRLSSATKGRGTLTSRFAGYRECPPDVKAERARRGVNPLDQAKYILSVRKAMSQ